MPVIDPATGEQIATAASGSAADVERAARSARAAFDDGRWRFLAPLEKERRLRSARDDGRRARRGVRGAGRARRGLAPVVLRLHRAIRRRRHRLLRRLAVEAGRLDPARPVRVRRVPDPRADRRRRADHAVERADRRARLRRGGSQRRELRRAQACRADSDGRGADGRAGRRGRHPARRVQRGPGRGGRRRRGGRVEPRTSTPSPSRGRSPREA